MHENSTALRADTPALTSGGFDNVRRPATGIHALKNSLKIWPSDSTVLRAKSSA